MRLPRPRFTVRWLMLTVAASGLAFGTWTMYQRHQTFTARASGWRFLSRGVRCGVATMSMSEEEILEMDRRVNPHASLYKALAEKYERAARYPWLPVEPDPPLPE